MIASSELILNADGSIYHLNLLPEDLADTIIFVGDPDRVSLVSQHFDCIELKKAKREFITHTGSYKGKRISVISTGIGTDNIDIVLNEIDALVNIDFSSREVKKEIRSVDIIRIGTSGAIQPDIAMGTILASRHAVGFDTLMQFYRKPYSLQQKQMQSVIKEGFADLSFTPYIASASDKLLAKFAGTLTKGITMTAPGFYAPQGRSVRSSNVFTDLIAQASALEFDSGKITNLEMETAGIYALCEMFGHHALSINAILASRVNATFSENPEEIVAGAIKHVLDCI